jgi:glycosyltransferase involved in cell wall biosynthesis
MWLTRIGMKGSYDWEMSKPRVLHLATSLGGGAGIAARRIVQAQIDFGMESQLHAVKQSGATLASHESILQRNEVGNLKSKAATFLQSKVLQKSKHLVTPFSINFTKDWKKAIGDAEVIHIHAFYNLINLATLRQISTLAPVVITMHDQRLFTGGCHYSGPCASFKSDCNRCPQVRGFLNQIPSLQLEKSIKVFGEIPNLRVISPSKWLADLAKESPVLSNAKIEVLSNPVPDLFTPIGKSELPKNENLRIGFISEDLNNPNKGLQVLTRALERLPVSFQAEIQLIGRGLAPNLGSQFKISNRYLNKHEDIARAIQSCDVVVVPSLQDNSPSVVSETLMCGIPVIGSRVGGITEILDEFDLPSFQRGNSLELSALLARFNLIPRIEIPYSQIKEKYSPSSSAAAHMAIYQECLD